MDKKTLYEKVEKALNQAFEVTKASAKVLYEKAGEAAHLSKLYLEKAGIEHKVSKKFAALGSQIFEKTKISPALDVSQDETIQSLIEETKVLAQQLEDLEKAIEEAKREKK